MPDRVPNRRTKPGAFLMRLCVLTVIVWTSGRGGGLVTKMKTRHRVTGRSVPAAFVYCFLQDVREGLSPVEIL